MTLSSKGRLGADYARVPWPRHMLSQPWLITEQTPSARGSLRPGSPRPTLQADNSTRPTACQEGLAPGPWKFTLTTPNPGTTSHNLSIHTVHISITDNEKIKINQWFNPNQKKKKKFKLRQGGWEGNHNRLQRRVLSGTAIQPLKRGPRELASRN